MDHYEMVEKLRQKANVSYEEAKSALEAADWDILDALVLLEGQGRVRPEQKEYTTRDTAEPKAEQARSTRSECHEGARKLGAALRKLIEKGNQNAFVISRRGKEVVSFSVNVLVLLVVLIFPWTLIVLGAGLFLGLRYSFKGPDFSSKINDTLNRAADAAENIKTGTADKDNVNGEGEVK